MVTSPPPEGDSPLVQPTVTDDPPPRDSPPVQPTVTDDPPPRSKKRVIVKARTKQPPSSESDNQTAKAKLNSITEGLDANFRALMELHEKVSKLNT